MVPFSAYSQYYDLLYQDKDYIGEVAYVSKLLLQFAEGSRSILELGCGTGRHASLLAAAGFNVYGVELSDTMLQQSLTRAGEVLRARLPGSFHAIAGDARHVRVEKTFDAVVSLFHVVSYQVSNDDIRQMFETASVHLRAGGVFLFDVWYGPAVLKTHPGVRVKRIENDRIDVLRIAEPDVNLNKNLVHVNYSVLVTEKTTGALHRLTETHHMRYYFQPELELLAEQAGCHVIHAEEWLTSNAPSEHTWGVTFVARKKGLSTES